MYSKNIRTRDHTYVKPRAASIAATLNVGKLFLNLLTPLHVLRTIVTLVSWTSMEKEMEEKKNEE
jgi:hypothetical protein